MGAGYCIFWECTVGMHFSQNILKKVSQTQTIAFERTFDLIRRKGFYGIFISKLIPMVRTLISIPAGVLKMEFIKYSIASFWGYNFGIPYSWALAILLENLY